MFKRTRTITRTEQHSRTVIHLEGGVQVWCNACELNAWVLGIDEASVLCEMRARDVFRLVENGEIHFFEPDDGRLLICLPSLNAYSRSMCEKPALPGHES